MSDYIRQKSSKCSFDTSEPWVILSPIEQSIKSKSEAKGTPLKKWDVRINYGIKTGFNDAFIINGEKRQEILNNCQASDERKRTDELIRPILRGRDIKRYGYEYANLYLIATFPAKHYDIDEFPAVKKFLEGFQPELNQTGQKLSGKDIDRIMAYGESQGIKLNRKDLEKSRKKTCNKWFETQDSIGYWEDFSKQKVMWKIIGCNINFSYDDSAMICNNAVNIMTGKKTYLLQFVGLMNSKLFDWYLKITTEAGVQGGGVQLYVTTLEKTPLKLDFEKSFSDLVEKKCKGENISDDELDERIFSLYNLSKEEREYVLTNYKPNTSI